MKYYKIILNSQIIGVCTSNSCFRFQQKNQMLIKTSEDKMEYLECNNKLYHAEWMLPIQTNLYSYQLVTVIEIEEGEYNILLPASENTPIDFDYKEDEEIVIPDTDPADEITINFVREAKINEMSRTCNKTIEKGFDIVLSGETHHFSLTVQDQLNLISLSAMATQGIQYIPYHADGELCKYYTPEEITAIVNQATYFKTYHTTYFNGLKAYINSLETIEEINAITYGTPLPEEYQTDVWKQLNQ